MVKIKHYILMLCILLQFQAYAKGHNCGNCDDKRSCLNEYYCKWCIDWKAKSVRCIDQRELCNGISIASNNKKNAIIIKFASNFN